MKQYLGQLSTIKKRLRYLYDRMDFIETEYLNVKSPSFSGRKTVYRGNSSYLGGKIDKYDAEYQSCKKEAKELEIRQEELYFEITSMIESLDDEDERWVMHQRYIRLRSGRILPEKCLVTKAQPIEFMKKH